MQSSHIHPVEYYGAIKDDVLGKYEMDKQKIVK